MNCEKIREEDILQALKIRWQLIIGITLAVTILATVLNFFWIKPKYEASTKLFIGKEINGQADKSYDGNDILMYQNLLKTYSDVILTRDLVNKSLKNRNIDLSTEDVLGNLNATPKTATQILVISYTSTDKQKSKDVVEAITEQFIKTSSELISNVNVKVVESVTLPQNPVSPNKKLNIAISLLLGLMASIGFSLMLEFMDNTFKDKEQIENIVGIPTLGSIPHFQGKR